jgi:hypothetical protein
MELPGSFSWPREGAAIVADSAIQVTLLQVTLWFVLAQLLLLLLMQMAEIRLGVQRWMEVWELLLHWRYSQLVQMWQLRHQQLQIVALWQLQLPGSMLHSKEMQYCVKVNLNVEIGPLFSLG